MSGKVDDHLGAIPVEGGREKNGEPLYIARAYYKDGIHPGKAGRHLEGWLSAELLKLMC